jgi:hypothetical protein
MFKEFYQIIKSSQLSLPSLEVALFVMLLSLALLYRYNRAGIVIAYVFAARWGWMVVHNLPTGAQASYVILGILVGFLAIVSMISDPHY